MKEQEAIVNGLTFANEMLLAKFFCNMNLNVKSQESIIYNSSSKCKNQLSAKKTGKTSKFQKANTLSINKISKKVEKPQKIIHANQVASHRQNHQLVTVHSDNHKPAYQILQSLEESRKSEVNQFQINYHKKSRIGDSLLLNQSLTIEELLKRTAVKSNQSIGLASPINTWRQYNNKQNDYSQKILQSEFERVDQQQMPLNKNKKVENHQPYSNNRQHKDLNSIQRQEDSYQRPNPFKGKLSHPKFQTPVILVSSNNNAKNSSGAHKNVDAVPSVKLQKECRQIQHKKIVAQQIESAQIQVELNNVYPQKQFFKQDTESHNQQKTTTDYEKEYRNTCELEPSKLQRLIEVQHNKYKQLVLKNYYKRTKH